MAHRYRLYPTDSQEPILTLHASHARAIWNAALEQFNCWRPGSPASPSNSDRSRQLAEARAEIAWLAEGSSSVQQQALRDFNQAVRNWWRGTHGRPSWRKRGTREGFCVRDVSVRKLSRNWAELTVPKAGRVRFRLSRPIPDTGGMARVCRDGKGRWHVAFPAPQAAVDRSPTGAVLGIDRGVATTLATTDGQMLRAPIMRDREHRRIVRLQRQLSRQVKGSRRSAETKRRIGSLHQGVADRRRNWIETQTTRLIREYDVICVEKLLVRNMVRRPKPKPDPALPGAYLPNGANAKSGLNRSIHAQGWSVWLRRLEDKANASGVCIVSVAPNFTSQRCRCCGHTASENRKSQAVFLCQRCGHKEHADTHAAENILARGLEVVAPTPGHGAGRRSAAGAAHVSRPEGAVRTTGMESANAA